MLHFLNHKNYILSNHTSLFKIPNKARILKYDLKMKRLNSIATSIYVISFPLIMMRQTIIPCVITDFRHFNEFNGFHV